ncbi:MAG: hypothetical protein QME58_01710 [Bacteroidota bacterium]|nr:hypothetical protein [Bacteroidota bacterium]
MKIQYLFAVGGFAFIVSISIINFDCTTQKTTLSHKYKSMRTIEQVLEENTPRLMLIPGVVGTAIGECNDTPCIKVLVNVFTEELELKIPKSIEGFAIEIEEVGEIRPL